MARSHLPNYRIAIVGAGAIGCYYGAKLACFGRDVRGFPLPAAAALEQVTRTESMGAHKPSTLVDFQAGRPLEVEAIWGEPLRRAAAAGALAPRLYELCEKLKTMDSRRTSATGGTQARVS